MKKPSELKITTAIIIFSIAVLAKFIIFGIFVIVVNKLDLVISPDALFNFFPAISLIIDTLIIVIILPWFNVELLRQLRNVQFNLLILFVLLAVLVFVLIQPIVDPINFVKKISQNQLVFSKLNFSLSSFTNFNKIIYFILIVIVTPIVEEIVYRGILFNLLLKKYSIKIAFVASSLIFALIHVRFAGIGFLFLYGLFFGYAYYKTKSLIAPILAHFTINFLSSFSKHTVVELNSASFIKYFIIYITSIFLIFVIFSIINKMQLFKFNTDNSSDKQTTII